MNTLTKQLIGIVIGGITGYFIGDVVVEYIRAKEYLESRKGETNKDLLEEEIEEEITMERIPMKKKGSGQSPKNYVEFYSNAGRPDLAALASKYNGDNKESPENEVDDSIREFINLTDKAIEDMEGEEDEFKPIEENKDPSIISVDEFLNDDEYAKVKLFYFEDDVLTTEQNKVIQRPEKFLGDDALISFGQLSGDETKVYIRNSFKKAMYEIVRLNKNYMLGQVKIAVKRQTEKLIDKEKYDDEEAST